MPSKFKCPPSLNALTNLLPHSLQVLKTPEKIIFPSTDKHHLCCFSQGKTWLRESSVSLTAIWEARRCTSLENEQPQSTVGAFQMEKEKPLGGNLINMTLWLSFYVNMRCIKITVLVTFIPKHSTPCRSPLFILKCPLKWKKWKTMILCV